jgi:hypothetical protein
MCEALQGSDDLVQSVQGVMPCNVGDLEDLDEGILPAFLSKKRFPVAAAKHKHLHNAPLRPSLKYVQETSFHGSIRSSADRLLGGLK